MYSVCLYAKIITFFLNKVLNYLILTVFYICLGLVCVEGSSKIYSVGVV